MDGNQDCDLLHGGVDSVDVARVWTRLGRPATRVRVYAGEVVVPLGKRDRTGTHDYDST